MGNVLILGAQWGDEGKGKIVDLLAPKASCVVRFQGGSNAGHTIIKNGKKSILHLVPSGILDPGKTCVIGNGVVIDLEALNKEIDGLKEQGIQFNGNFFISDIAHVVMPYHKVIDANREANLKKAKIGTTGKGIGPVYQDKMARIGFRMGEINSSASFKERFFAMVEEKQFYLKNNLGVNDVSFNAESMLEELLANHAKLAQYVTDSVDLLNNLNDKKETILFEGAQGSFLDIDHGTYPFVTSSNTTAGGAATGSGLPPSAIGHVIGITKAYTTRVGSGPFPTELNDDDGQQLQKVGMEFGATTGRVRRCGWFDAVLMKRSVRINGINSLAITKLDILDGFDRIKICTAYKTKQGAIINRPPNFVEQYEGLEPIYEELPGWKSPISDIRDFDQLPKNCKNYLARIQELLGGVALSIVSVGPGNEQTISLSDPFHS